MAERLGNIPAQAMPGDDAARLTQAVARGDAAALAEFYSLWFDRCCAAARRITGRDEAFCLDVVQEAMLKVVRSIRPMRSDAELAAWMMRVVKSAAMDMLRTEQRRSKRERAVAEASPGIAQSPAALALAAEQTGWSQAALDGLTAQDRTLIAERVGGGRSLEKAGAAAGLSGDAAHGRLRRVFTRLRAKAREVFDD